MSYAPRHFRTHARPIRRSFRPSQSARTTVRTIAFAARLIVLSWAGQRLDGAIAAGALDAILVAGLTGALVLIPSLLILSLVKE